MKKNKSNHSIETKTEIITFKNDIIFFQAKKDSFHELADAQENVKASKIFSKNGPLPGLIDISEVKGLSNDARDYYTGHENAKILSKAALLINNPLSTFIGNIFINSKNFPVKLFYNKDQALEWLSEPVERSIKSHSLTLTPIILVTICSLFPLFLTFIGVDLNLKSRENLGTSDSIFFTTIYEHFKGPSIHFLFEMISLTFTFLISIFAYLGRKVSRGPMLSMIAATFISISVIDLTHILASVGMIEHSSNQVHFISFTWLTSQLYQGFLLLIGTVLCFNIRTNYQKNTASQNSLKTHLLMTISLISTCALLYFLIHLDHLPNTNPGTDTLAWQYTAIALYFILSLTSFVYLRNFHSTTALTILVSCIPNVLVHMYIIYGETNAYDSNFLYANLAKIFSHVVFMYGIVRNYILSIQHLHEDIDSFKNSRLTLQKINEAIDAGALISIADRRGIITSANENFQKISQYSQDELKGQNHRILKSDEHPPEFFKDMWETISSGKFWQGEIKNKAKDGSYYWVYSTIYPAYNQQGMIESYVSIRFDITKRKSLEKELQIAIEKSEVASKVKSEFLAKMSHEIRTPMNGLVGNAELLNDSNDLSEKNKNYLNNILDSSSAMMGIVNDILDFSSIETESLQLEMEHVNLTKLLHNLVNFYDLQASSKDLFLEFEPEADLPEYIQTDSKRLRQIISNLLANAIKFTDVGGIKLNAQLLDQDAKSYQLKFSVQDTGKGIDLDNFENIFHSFIQEDNTSTRKYGGIGLGLSICKELTELLGGKIWIEKNRGQGTTFIFTIKAEKVDRMTLKPEISASEDVEYDSRHLKVLLVEDNYINRELACAFLSGLNIKPQIAINGKEALDLAKQQQFDLILMDCQMPILDGYLATKAIRKLNTNHKPFIIALTANALDGDRQKCLEAGMDDYITKPLSKKKLQKTIQNVFFNKKMKDAS